jgi:hypothetical protein
MTAAEVGFAAVSRAVVSAAADLVADVERIVVGDENVRTAQGNAWAAMCADRARAQARADVEALVAALASRPGGPDSPPRGSRRHSAETAAAASVERPGGDQPGGDQRSVGSSPRSSASQAALVSTR